MESRRELRRIFLYLGTR